MIPIELGQSKEMSPFFKENHLAQPPWEDILDFQMGKSKGGF